MFLGRSASEMLAPLGLTVKDPADEAEVADALRVHFIDAGGAWKDAMRNRAVGVLREFLVALIDRAETETEGVNYDVPVWRGLLMVDDHYTLLSFASMLVERMGTES